MNTQLGISALRLSKNFADITVYCYQVAFAEQPDPVQASQQLRSLATKLKFKNQCQTITDFNQYRLVSLSPIKDISVEGVSITAMGAVQFKAEAPAQRSALQRLINQSIYSGAQAFSYSLNLSCDKAAQAATRLRKQRLSPKYGIMAA